MLHSNARDLFLLSVWFSSPILATKEVACGLDGTEYFYVSYHSNEFTGGGVIDRCFADAGNYDIDQNDVASFSSGNNAGHFDYDPGDGYRYRHTFSKHQQIVPGNKKGDGWGYFISMTICEDGESC